MKPAGRKAAPKPRKPLEHPIMKAIEAAINHSGLAVVWRQNSGARTDVHKGKKRFVRFSAPGAADLTGLVARSGRRLEIEVKRHGEMPTPKQQAFGQNVSRWGGIWFVAFGVEDALTKLNEAIKGGS